MSDKDLDNKQTTPMAADKKPEGPVEVKKVEPVPPLKPEESLPPPPPAQAPKPAENKQGDIKITIGGPAGGKKLNNQFAHNTAQDVNSNIGSFGEDIKDPSKDAPKPEDELIVSDKSKQFENIKGKDVEIDFAKFDKKKQRKVKKQKEYKPGKTQFAVTLDTWLHNRATCIKVWMVALAIMVVCMGVGLGLAIPGIININNATAGWWQYYINNGHAMTGVVFGFIAGSIFLIPLIYLLITTLVGIRGTASSRIFHYFLWTTLIIAFVSAVICAGLLGQVFAIAAQFTPFPS